MTNDEYIELRVAYPGHPGVALIDGMNESCNLHRRRIGDCLYHRREHLAGGTMEQVYRLPLMADAIYEIVETINGRRAVATSVPSKVEPNRQRRIRRCPVTGGSVWLWCSLCISVFSFFFGIGGVLHAINGEEYGWHVVGVSIGVHFANCIGVLAYYLR